MHIPPSPAPRAAEPPPASASARATRAGLAGDPPGVSVAGFLRLAGIAPPVAADGQGGDAPAPIDDGAAPPKARAVVTEEGDGAETAALAALPAAPAEAALTGAPPSAAPVSVAPGPPREEAIAAAATPPLPGNLPARAAQRSADAPAPAATASPVAALAAPPPGAHAAPTPVAIEMRTAVLPWGFAVDAAATGAVPATPETRVTIPAAPPQPVPAVVAAVPGLRALAMAEPGQTADLPGLAASGRLPGQGPAPDAPALPGPPNARHVAAQIALQAAPATTPGGPATLELRLDPPELGQVRMTLGLSDQGVTLHLVADRPETLDLLRRHVALLGEEFARQGLGSASFSFAESDAHQSPGQGDARGPGHAGGAAPPPAPALAPRPVLIAAGLDIRL